MKKIKGDNLLISDDGSTDDGNAVMAVGGGTITLADVHASAVKASDFHFV
jgi:hypothetical protein